MPTAAGVFPDRIQDQRDFSGSLVNLAFLRYVTADSAFELVAVTASLIGLGSVENTALSTWGGSAFVTTLGTVVTGVWHGTVIAGTYGGTGVNNGAKTLTFLKSLSFTAADDTGTYTLPTGTKTLLATDGAGTGLTGIVYALTGTANQVIFSASTGNVTASLPQSIATTSTPTFASQTLTAANALTLGTASSIAGAIVLKNATNSNTLTIQSGVTGTTVTYTLPTADLTNGYLKSNGSGVLSWATVTAGDVSTTSANTFVIAPQTITIDDATHSGLVINGKAGQSAAAINLKDSSANACVQVYINDGNYNGISFFNSTNNRRWNLGCATASAGALLNGDFFIQDIQQGFPCLNIQTYTGLTILQSYPTGSAAFLGQFTLMNPYLTTTKILVLRGLASHTGNYLEMQQSDATVIQKVDSKGHEYLQAGTSATLAAVGGAIFDHAADGGSTHTDGTEDTCYTDTTAANTLAANNEKIKAEYCIVFVGSATATRRVRVYFAGTVVLDSGTLTFATGGNADIYVTIIRVSSTVVRVKAEFVPSGITLQPIVTYTELTSLTLSGTNILKVTGVAASTGAASGDIVAKLGTVEWQGAA